MDTKAIITQQERQFAEVVDIIARHRSHASRVVNEDTLLTAWQVGAYSEFVQPRTAQLENISSIKTETKTIE